MTCKAIQYSDQMNCAQCGLCWDVNDPEPPACQPKPGKEGKVAPKDHKRSLHF